MYTGVTHIIYRITERLSFTAERETDRLIERESNRRETDRDRPTERGDRRERDRDRQTDRQRGEDRDKGTEKSGQQENMIGE